MTTGIRRARKPFVQRKLFYLLDSLNVGGTETQAVELACRLDPAVYDVTLGCLQARGPLLEKLQRTSVHLEEFHPKGGVDSVRGMYQLFRLTLFLRQGRFDLFHSHDLWSNLIGIPAARMARVPVIISSRRDLGHLDWYETGRRVWLRRILNLSDVVLTNANAIRDALIAEDRFAPEKIRVIHNGIDVERFTCVSNHREQIFPDSNGLKLIVTVGNMHTDIKGHCLLIAAAPEVVRQCPAARFVFAGDGAQRAEFERQAAALGLREYFLFLGRRDDIPEVLRSCDIAVLPSKAEGLPNAALEYMCSSLPTIATAVGGNVEIIKHGETGLLVPPRNSDALGDAVLQLLKDPLLAKRIGEEGRRHVVANYSFERLIGDVDALYTDLLQRWRARS
jgi:L-malate glycosyltransferase